MLLIHSTDEFIINGISHPGIPILIDNEMLVVGAVLKFTVYQAIQNGSISSKNTIRSYTNSLYDFFSFLEANNLPWDKPYQPESGTAISVVALYRNWSASLTGAAALKASTINTRLAAIRQFYEFCKERKMIIQLPWKAVSRIRQHDVDSFFSNTRNNQNTDTTDLRLKTFIQPPKVLTLVQAKQLISKIDNTTLSLIVKMALTTGMRRDELISFQRDSVFKPLPSQINKRIPIDLIPRPGMQRTKGNRARTIYIPAPLMMELYEYTRFGEGVKRLKTGQDNSNTSTTNLFLNFQGEQFSERSLNTLLRKLYQKDHISFPVSPHMLRHTYATIELYAESQTKDMAQALAWVRDRLGHSSIQTTTVYVHCIEQLNDYELHQYQHELLAMAGL